MPSVQKTYPDCFEADPKHPELTDAFIRDFVNGDCLYVTGVILRAALNGVPAEKKNAFLAALKFRELDILDVTDAGLSRQETAQISAAAEAGAFSAAAKPALSGNDFSGAAGEGLCRAFAEKRILCPDELSLRNTRLNGTAVDGLCTAFHNGYLQGCRFLDIAGVDLSGKNGERFTKALNCGDGAALRVLDVRNTQLSDAAFGHLGKALRKRLLPHCAALRVSGNVLNGSGATGFAQALHAYGAPLLEELVIGEEPPDGKHVSDAPYISDEVALGVVLAAEEGKLINCGRPDLYGVPLKEEKGVRFAEAVKKGLLPNLKQADLRETQLNKAALDLLQLHRQSNQIHISLPPAPVPVATVKTQRHIWKAPARSQQQQRQHQHQAASSAPASRPFSERLKNETEEQEIIRGISGP